MVEGLIGLLFATLMIIVAKISRSEPLLFSIGLICLPLIYLGFAVLRGDVGAAYHELLYGVPFIAVGVICSVYNFRLSGLVLGAFWWVHAMYDVLHDQIFINTGVPSWYPVFCAAIDVLIGVYIFYQIRSLPECKLKEMSVDD